MKYAKSLLAVGIVTAGLLISFGYVSIKNDVTSIMNSGSNKKVVEKKQDIDIEITGIKTTEVNGTASGEEPTYTKTSATFESNLIQKGDSIVYTVTIKNNGTVNANLSDVNITPQEDGSEAIYYVVDSPAEVLEAGATTEMKVVASYDDQYVGYTSSNSKTATATVLYAQAN